MLAGFGWVGKSGFGWRGDMPRIRIRRKRNPGHWGMAYPAKRVIDLDPDLDDRTLLDIAVHEVAHVEIPDLDESAVDRLGKSAADVLWRLGFRREE